MAKKVGATVKDLYWAQGQYDSVNNPLQAPDDFMPPERFFFFPVEARRFGVLFPARDAARNFFGDGIWRALIDKMVWIVGRLRFAGLSRITRRIP